MALEVFKDKRRGLSRKMDLIVTYTSDARPILFWEERIDIKNVVDEIRKKLREK